MLVFWVENRFDLELYWLGVYPGSYKGLIGVITAPLIHGSASHLMSNALPILVLGLAIRYFYYEDSLKIFYLIWLITGTIVWIFARESYHIGASGVVYGFASFIFFSGILRGKVQLLALSLLIAFLYGGMVWGMLPIDAGISWESHVAGGLSGLGVSFFFRKTAPYEARVFIEEDEEEDTADKPELEKEGDKIFSATSCSKAHITSINYNFTPNQDKKP